MSFGSRPRSKYGSGGGPPTWLIFVVGTALVFGGYYILLGVQNYLQTGGLGVVEATERAEIIGTATAESGPRFATQGSLGGAPRTTPTPIPSCEEFVVSVPNAIVREQPSLAARIVTSFSEGDQLCVVDHNPQTEWYTIDSNPRTRRIEAVYMHETVIHAVNPTPTPSDTPTPLPTITPTLSPTASITPSPQPTATRDPRVSDTPTPTDTPTATQSFQSA